MKKILLLFLISLLTFQIQAQKSKYVSSTIKPQERSNIEKSLNWASTSPQHISDTRGYEIGVSAAPVDRDSIYHEVDIAPSFPGGDESIRRFIAQNLIKPKGSKGEVVLVKFLVERYGEISKVHIVESNGDPQISAEAIRVVKKMGSWNPGKIRGVEVASYYVLPVRF
ncbi:MAG: energy transducer TonB [Flectobacillus sp.]|uniref:energy transducer TonB n=1 Tax=Flectobacillus sp. TaxID=50419 RepID=UPI003B99C240